MDEPYICSVCFDVINESNKLGCPECLLFTHSDCIKRSTRRIESCLFCDRKSAELKLRLVPREVNEALNWVWWHMQQEVGVQMKLLRELDHRSATNQFETSEDFLILVKQSYCNILATKAVDKATLSVYRKLHEVAIREIEDFQRCNDCFKARHRYEEYDRFWISCVCKEPHLLVYAKLARYPYWPAKVLSRKRNTDEILCRFFGTQNESLISLKNCFLLSEEYPADLEPKDRRYVKSKEELDRHIKELRSRFPDFRLAPPKHPVNPNQLSLLKESMFFRKEENELVNCDTKEENHKRENEETEESVQPPSNDVENGIVETSETSGLKMSYNNLEEAQVHLSKRKKRLVVAVPRCRELERMIGKVSGDNDRVWYLGNFTQKL